MADKDKKSDKDEGGTVFLVLVVAALVLALIVPVLIGGVAYWATRSKLGRKEYLTLLGMGVLAATTQPHYVSSTYIHWISQITKGHVAVLGAPWLALISLSAVFAGAIGVLMGTRISAKLPKMFRRGDDNPWQTILPSDAQRKRAASIVSIPGGMTIAPETHSVLNPVKDKSKVEFPIGTGTDGQPMMLSVGEIRTHGLILGGTGSGKTETIKALMGNLLDLGLSGMILDCKEDAGEGGFREWCEVYAHHHGIGYQELCLSDAGSETWFNPLADMGPDEMRDTILSLQEFEAAYYEALNKELLGQVVNLMCWAHQADPVKFPFPTMYDIAKVISTGDLKNATKAMRAVVLAAIPGTTPDDFRVLENPAKAQVDAATGFGSRLANIYESQAGRAVLRPASDGSKRLLDVTAGGLTYVGLDSQGKADLTKMISSAVLQRMSVYAAQRTIHGGDKAQRFLIVDEANWVNRKIVQNLLSRARSAGISMWLCTQGATDWIDKNGNDWATLSNNINVAVIMSQGAPDSAELCAEFLGKTYQQARNTTGGFVDEDGKKVVREELSYRVDPDDLRRLRIGEAVIRVGKPIERVFFAKVHMRDPKKSAW